MSIDIGNSNNRNQLSGTSAISPAAYPRDPDFYFSDGSTVFLVEGVLFKLQASLLCPKGRPSQVISFVTDGLTTCRPEVMEVLDCSNTSGSQLGISDNRPIIIPRLKASELRVLLMVIMGVPGDALYMSFLADAHSKYKHSKALLLRYLNLMITAFRFGFRELANWALQQIELVLESAAKLATSEWDEVTMAEIWIGLHIINAFSDEDSYSLHMFFLLILSMSIDCTPILQSETFQNTSLCAALYQGCPHFSETDSDKIFGLTLPFVLCLGPHSQVWNNQLAQDRRFGLYLAYPHLVSLEQKPGLYLEWTLDPSSISAFQEACSDCSIHLAMAWRRSFGQVGSLDSSAPLADIRKLVALPQYRQIFVDQPHNLKCPMRCLQKSQSSIDAYLWSTFSHDILELYRELI